MKVIAMIPARYSASRFPGKLMKDLGGKPVIVRTYEATVSTQLFDEVYVVTDSDIIYRTIQEANGNVLKSQKEHSCGSDRIAEAVSNIDADIVVNVQGDEPFIDRDSLSKLIQTFREDLDHKIDLASLKVRLKDSEDINNPNNVKVITDLDNFALYFSRSPIPFPRNTDNTPLYYKHIGVYAFRKKALLDFYHMNETPLEAAEKIECIRYLEVGKRIKMIETSHQTIGIDTPEDLEKALKYFEDEK